MLVGYARVSKGNGVQNLDLQLDALKSFGVDEKYIYTEEASGNVDNRAQLCTCVKSLREGDTLVVWSLDRLGRGAQYLLNLIDELHKKKVHLKILNGLGAMIDTAGPMGQFIFQLAATMAELERNMIVERVNAGLESARARGRIGGRKFKLTPTKLHLIQGALKNRETDIIDVCKEFGIAKTTLYRHLSPTGEFRTLGSKLLNKDKKKVS